MWIELSVSGPARGIVDSPLHVGDQGISRALLMGHFRCKRRSNCLGKFEHCICQRLLRSNKGLQNIHHHIVFTGISTILKPPHLHMFTTT